MRAVRFHEYGGPQVLRYEEAPDPEIGADEVLIRTAGAAVNPADWKIRAGLFKDRRPSQLPEIPGTDVSGIVEAVGPMVQRFAPGDRVVARTEACYAELVRAKTDAVARAPRTMPLVEAAGIPVAGGVAWLVLFDVAKLRAGQTVLVHAGSGGVGSFAIQLAKLAGARVVTTASRESEGLLRRLGADEVIDHRTEDFSCLVKGVDVVFDTLGGEVQARSWATLKPGGMLASIVAPPDADLARAHEARSSFGRRELNGAILEELVRLVDDRHLRVLIDSIFPLAEAQSAQERSASGRARGKIILKTESGTS